MAAVHVTSVKLIDQGPTVFTLKRKGRRLFLESTQFGDYAKYHQVAVRLLSENESLQRKGCFCCCFKSDWVDVQVILGNESCPVMVKVSDMVKNWGLSEETVRQWCEIDFSELVQIAVKQMESRQQFLKETEKIKS